MAERFWLNDAQWAVIEPLLPRGLRRILSIASDTRRSAVPVALQDARPFR
jgi:transposase